jgi:putative intracellular protease/amidase
MRKRSILLGTTTAVTLLVAAVLIVLSPGNPAPFPEAPPIEESEHARTIDALRPSKRKRPVIAIITLNDATEVTDLFVPYGVLSHANVADVTVVAEHADQVRLHPFSALGQGPELLRVEPQSTTRAFDERYPGGADYVVVPALEPRNNQHVLDWIVAQHRKGAKIFSVCAGSLTLAAAGQLDKRPATRHWAYIDALRKAHPTMRWVPDRRYVAADNISTSTGITASIPVTVALVEAIAGRSKAEQLARDLGVPNWDARHRSSAFQLTWEHQKTFLRNWLSFWRRETIGVPVSDGVDEIVLALTADAYSRTALSSVTTIGISGKVVRSRHGLLIHASTSAPAAAVDHMLPALGSDSPAATLDRELAHIASRYGTPTGHIVALVVEYPDTEAYVERALKQERPALGSVQTFTGRPGMSRCGWSGRRRHPLEKVLVAQHQATVVHHQISFETARETKVDVT